MTKTFKEQRFLDKRSFHQLITFQIFTVNDNYQTIRDFPTSTSILKSKVVTRQSKYLKRRKVASRLFIREKSFIKLFSRFT